MFDGFPVPYDGNVDTATIGGAEADRNLPTKNRNPTAAAPKQRA